MKYNPPLDIIKPGIVIVMVNSRFIQCPLNSNSPLDIIIIRYRNRNFPISTAPTKAKSQESAYAQALNQYKIVGRIIRQAGRQLWCMELRQEGAEGKDESG